MAVGEFAIIYSLIPRLSGYPCFMAHDPPTLRQGYNGAKGTETSFFNDAFAPE